MFIKFPELFVSQAALAEFIKRDILLQNPPYKYWNSYVCFTSGHVFMTGSSFTRLEDFLSLRNRKSDRARLFALLTLHSSHPAESSSDPKVARTATENWGLLRERSYWALQRSSSTRVLCSDLRDLQCLRSSVLGQGI